jgi:hypothetical protein
MIDAIPGDPKRYNISRKRMDRVIWEGFKKENQLVICTKKFASMHRFVCMAIIL